MLPHLPIIKQLPTVMGQRLSVDVTIPTNEGQQSINRASTEHQQSINDFQYCIFYNSRVMLLLLPINKILPTFMGNMVNVDHGTPTDDGELSINNVRGCICDNPRAMLLHLAIIEVLPSFMGHMFNVDIAAPKNKHQQSINRVSIMFIIVSFII
jgi:hypothetical protein